MQIRLDTPSNSKKLDWLGNVIRLPIRSSDTSGRLCGQLANLAAGSGNPPHVHTRESECFVVLDGEVHLRFGDRSEVLRTGDLAYLAAGLPHQLISVASSTAKLLVLLTDGEIENAFIKAADGDEDAMTETFARFSVEIMEEYDPEYRPAGFASVSEDDCVIARYGEGDAYWLAGDTYTVMLPGEASDEQLAVVHFDIPPGGGPVPHIHTRDFEAFVITEGEVELYADGAVVTGRVGDVAVLPENIPHCFKNRTDRTVQMIAVVTPAGFDRFIAEVGQSPVAGQSPPPVGDAEKKRLKEAAPKYGITLRPDIDF